MTENKLCAVEAVKELLLSQNNILLVSHRNPDGDTLGSNAALCSALRRAGKTAYLFPNPQVTDKFFPFISEFFAPDGFVPDFTVAVDVPAPDMLSNGFTGKPDLCIDHHPTNPCYGETANLIQPEKAACGEIILSLIEAMHGTATPREADLLYIAVSTDTGCFQYANTGSDTFLSAARIVSYGASNADLNVIFFRKVSKARLKLEGMIYSGMYFYRNGEVVVSTVTLDMMEKCRELDERRFHRDAIARFLAENGDMDVYIHTGYAKAIHTVDAYYGANMDMLDGSNRRQMFPADRPVRTKTHEEVSTYYGENAFSRSSLVADNCIIEGTVENSIIFSGVHIGKGAVVRNSIIMRGCDVGEWTELTNVIADKKCSFAPGITLTGSPRLPIVVPKASEI